MLSQRRTLSSMTIRKVQKKTEMKKRLTPNDSSSVLKVRKTKVPRMQRLRKPC